MPSKEVTTGKAVSADPRLLQFMQRYDDYARKFALPDGSFSIPDSRKMEHTHDVCAIIHLLMVMEDVFTPDAMFRADTAALFHDVSRFEQFQKFHTFRDAASFDHGDRSAELIGEAGLAPELTPEEHQEITASIRVHNKIAIPADFPQKYLHTAQLLRDADKLSILKVILRNFTTPEPDVTMRLDMPLTPGYSPEVLQTALDGKMLPHGAMKNTNDFLILLFTWTVDFHYRASAAYLRKHDLYGQLRKLLPEGPALDHLLEVAQERIQKLFLEGTK